MVSFPTLEIAIYKNQQSKQNVYAEHTLLVLLCSNINMFEERLHKEELTRLKRAFALFDVNGDGSISTKVINKGFVRNLVFLNNCYTNI